MQTFTIMVTGGGSSGHVSPALAIISTIRELAAGADWRPVFRYVGGRRGVERRLVEAAGVDFVGIETGKLRRYFDLENLTDMARLPIGLGQALAEVRRFRPDALLSTGGYVAVPPVLAARMLRVPILTHEQTVQIGLANRIAARFATTIALSFDGALDELPPRLRHRSIVTGNPVRPAIFGGERDAALRLAGFAHADDRLPTVYITGGSQGARVINRAVEAALPELLTLCRVVHQCGEQPGAAEQDYDRLEHAAQTLPPELRRRYFFTRFIGDEINHIFALADLVVGRAGAGTLAEICVLGKPAVYIPLVPTGGDEQTRNAQTCAAAGAATIIRQAELSGPRLLAELAPLLADRPRLVAMGRAARALGKPDAARDVARAVLALAGLQGITFIKEHRVTDTPEDGSYLRQGLDAAQLADVRALGRLCEQHDGIDLRLSWDALQAHAGDTPGDFRSYADGQLVGFLALDGIGEAEAEGTGMVHPARRRQGVFRALIDAAKAACRRQGTPELILYVDQRSASARPCMDAIGAEQTFSETKMRLADAGAVAAVAGRLDFRVAASEDAAAIGDILAHDIEGAARQLHHVVARNMQNPSYRYYIATLNGDPVGTLNIQTIDGDSYIYGFVVKPAYRGRGYGREILVRVLRDLAAERVQPVYLEVEPDNTPAVNLYRSLGFEALVTYDYYRLPT